MIVRYNNDTDPPNNVRACTVSWNSLRSSTPSMVMQFPLRRYSKWSADSTKNKYFKGKFTLEQAKISVRSWVNDVNNADSLWILLEQNSEVPARLVSQEGTMMGVYQQKNPVVLSLSIVELWLFLPIHCRVIRNAVHIFEPCSQVQARTTRFQTEMYN